MYLGVPYAFDKSFPLLIKIKIKSVKSSYSVIDSHDGFRFSWKSVYLLVDCRQLSKCGCMEDGAFVPFVVSLERKE